MSLQVFVNDGGLRRQTALRETATSSIPSTTLRPQSPGTDSATFRHSALSERASFILPSIDEQRNAHYDCASSGQRNLAHEGDEGSISNNGDSSSDRPTRMTAVGLLPTMDVVSDNSSEDLDFGSQNSNSSGGSINNCSSTIQSDFDLFLDNDDIFSTRDNTVTNANIAASKLSWQHQKEEDRVSSPQNLSNSSEPYSTSSPDDNSHSRRLSSSLNRIFQPTVLNWQSHSHRKQNERRRSWGTSSSSSHHSTPGYESPRHMHRSSSAPSPSKPSLFTSPSSSSSTPLCTSPFSMERFFERKPKGRLSSHNEQKQGTNWRPYMVHIFYSAGVIFQLLVLILILVLIVLSRSQASSATQALIRLKTTESLELLKLHRLEDHSLHVHELIRKKLFRIQTQSNANIADKVIDELVHGHKDSDEATTKEDSSTDRKDTDPLLAQYHQLRKMSDELREHEAVANLQEHLQETARDEIMNNYGEGPVKVVIELNFEDNEHHDDDAKKHLKLQENGGEKKLIAQMAKGTYLSVLLWPDAPHAAWAWLDQIQRGIWNGAAIKWNPTSTLLQILPMIEDPDDRGHLGFVEHHEDSDKQQNFDNPDTHHGAWTIGLHETLLDDAKNNTNSRLEMYINLTDNKEHRKHETCVGKIFDGFDALQRLVESTVVSAEGKSVTNVTVKTISAMHMPHQDFEKAFL